MKTDQDYINWANARAKRARKLVAKYTGTASARARLVQMDKEFCSNIPLNLENFPLLSPEPPIIVEDIIKNSEY